MGKVVAGLMIAAACAGCTNAQLRRSTLAQQSTLVDLQFQAVLDNVARFQVNPWTLPYFAYAGGGLTQISDGGNTDVGFVWDPHGLVSESLGLGASRAVVENWSLTAVNAPDRLNAMRCAYQSLVGCETKGCEEVLAKILGKNYPDFPPRGWYCCGAKCDVPRTACYVSHCGDTYVWVTPDGMDGFSKFTLGILQIATISAEALEKRVGTKDTGPPALQSREVPFSSFGPQFYPQITR